VLNDEQRREYAEQGFVVLRGLIEPSRIDLLNERLSHQIARIGGLHTSGERSTAFWQQMPRSRYDIEVFWHDDTGPYVESRVMRVGHALHLHDEAYRALLVESPLTPVLRELMPTIVQTAIVYKQPHSEAVHFGLHQDAAYLHADPAPGLALAFIALEDMDAENGALEVVPRSHRRGQGLRLRLEPSGFEFLDGGDPRFEPNENVLLEMKRGDVAMVHGHTYHASAPNQSSRTRRGLIVHGLRANAKLLPTSWVSAPPEGFFTL
jgi:ectoine hydroxylase